MARIADPGDGQRHLEALNTGKSDYTEGPLEASKIKINNVFFIHNICDSYFITRGEIHSEQTKPFKQPALYVLKFKTMVHHSIISPHWEG